MRSRMSLVWVLVLGATALGLAACARALVASVSDKTFQAGQFWIAVGESPGRAPTGATTEARFANLTITQD